ncbi:hypothetical protein ACQJBY_008215 [Aegilops geniculata]
MDHQELQEADVLWPQNNSDHRRDGGGNVDGDMAKLSSPELSAPVLVPHRKRRSRSWSTSDGSGNDDCSDGDVRCTNDAKRNVPPHVLAERRRRLAGKSTAAYSMCSGKGRTLKGRDLRNIRNLVLRLTGFIEK